MKIYMKLIPTIAQDILRVLSRDGDIEIKDNKIDEAILDVSKVFRDYLEEEEELNQEAMIFIQNNNLASRDFAAVKAKLAEERGFDYGDEAIEMLLADVVDALLKSKNIEEVYEENNTLIKKMYEVVKKYLDVDEELDKEAREQLKNLEEGTLEWDIAYRKAIHEIKKKKNLV
ncbi:MAG: DUF507 family protein [Deltaproteobacteria bacterium]|nr:DUF507 family protein [Deltaproteobacteria bacterium]